MAPPLPLRSLHLPLLGGLLIAFLGWGFIEISGEMLEGDTHAVDLKFLRAAQSFRATQPWLRGLMRYYSSLGSAAVMTLFTIVKVGYLPLTSKPRWPCWWRPR